MQLLEREDALAELAKAQASAARGRGRVVLVTGEPGIGKTSLVAHFAAQAGSRVLMGTCDDLTIPRPLSPFLDWADCVSVPLEQAIARGASPQELHPLLIEELSDTRRPTTLVLEDVHWADDATLDAITFLSRRIASLPALLVLTVRAGETPLDHPLHAALGAIPAADTHFIELAPLSADAVATLAGDVGGFVYGATGGNPFYVTEMVAFCAEEGDVPPSVANAVGGRTSRLTDEERRFVELVSVVPRRIRTSTLDAVMPNWPALAAGPERRHLIEVGPRWVSFRHELVRHAVRMALPAATCRQLHAEILEVLLVAGADPADVVHHAEAAGADRVVGEHALVAARRAASVSSNREAFAHYRRALDFLGRLPPAEQATVLEETATAAYHVGRLEDALAANERAIPIWRALDDTEAVGRCTRVQSRLLWFFGDGISAREWADRSIEILEPLGDSAELGFAYAGRAQLAMLNQEGADARFWGERALALAERLGNEPTRIHTLVSLGTTALQADPDDDGPLCDAYLAANEAGERFEAIRALSNAASSLTVWGRPQAAAGFARRAVAYADEYEMHGIGGYARTTVAWLELRAGNWETAEEIARKEAASSRSVAELLARTVLAELAVRRGDADSAERLAELAQRAERAGELQRLIPVLELRVERSLTGGEPAPLRALQRVVTERARNVSVRFGAAAALAGLEPGIETTFDTPYARVLAGDWRGAADAFGEIGWTYDRALMLSLLDDEEALAEAVEIARSLGAAPLERRVSRRLRAFGHRVPRGPREATRANPAGLTARQLEVLTLLGDGRTNAEIADELVVSLRTAEHHVAAVLSKLGADSRRDAARRASELLR
jgi:DNA-binding CsgD family transcriptional regulator